MDKDNKEKEPKINKKSKKKEDPNSLKNGILSIIGGIFHKIAIGSVFVALAFSSYMISYLHGFENGKDLTQQHSYFLMPILTVTMGLGIPFSAILEFKLGTQRSIILGSILLIISSGILYVSHSFYLNLLAIFFFAGGLAVSIAISGKNACMYFPEKRGAVSGFLSLINAIVSSSLNLFGEKVIINPNSVDPEDGYYSVEVSKNILNYYLFQMACVGVCTLISILFIVPYKMKGNKPFPPKKKKGDDLVDNIEKDIEKNEPLIPEDKNAEPKEKETDEKEEKEEKGEEKKEEKEKEEKEKEEKEIKEEDKKPLTENQEKEEKEDNKINDDKPIEVKNTDEKKNEKKENKKKKKKEKSDYVNPLGGMESSMVNASMNNYSVVQIKKAAKSFRVWRLFLMGIFSSPLNNFILLTWRPISIFKRMQTNKIQNVNSYSSIIQMIVTPLFGYLSDKLPFRLMKVTLSLINTIVGFLFYSSFTNVDYFIILILVNGFAFHGAFTLNEPHYMKVFGMKHFIEIAGIVGLSSVIMGPIISIFAFTIEKNFKDNLDTAYKFMFLSGASLNIVDVVLSLFETDDPLFEE